MRLPDFIKIPVLAAYRKAIQLNIALNRYKYQYVFVLAHMRSGSTLLAHILANHPEFSGAGETHVVYKTSADLNKLAIITCQRLRTLKLDAKYIVDQVNHDNYLSDETLASQLIPKCVILIRQPEATLQSMIGLFEWEENVALDSYIRRLKGLVRHGLVLRERALLIEYDDLVDRPQAILDALTKFFGVAPPFKSTYSPLRTTGRFGDPSSNIRAGQIIRTQSQKIRISANALEEASKAFQESRTLLLRNGAHSAQEFSSLLKLLN